MLQFFIGLSLLVLSDAPTTTLSGKVVDISGEPIEGAIVRVSSFIVANISSPQLPPGTKIHSARIGRALTGDSKYTTCRSIWTLNSFWEQYTFKE